MRTSHTDQFEAFTAKTPEIGDYGLFLRKKKDKVQIGGPNYYNNGGSQFSLNNFIYG